MKDLFRYMYKWLTLFLKRWIVSRRLVENREMTDRLFSPEARILLLAPHPDDEIFGLGGYLLRYRGYFAHDESLNSMEQFFICYLTDGEHSLPDLPAHDVKYNRIELSKCAIKRLKFSHHNILRLHLPDGCLSELQTTELSKDSILGNAYQHLSDYIRKNDIDTILAPHVQDFWPFDHVATYRLAKDLSRQHFCRFYAYWVWAWYQQPIRRFFRLNKKQYSLLPIGKVLAEKENLIELYLKEKAPDGNSWSGILPKVFVKSNSWKYEVLERII